MTFITRWIAAAAVFSAAPALAYTCYASAIGGPSCGGSYSGYNAASKGLAIQDALSSCASSAGSGCTCVYQSCSDAVLLEQVNPDGEHDHFLGSVVFSGTGRRLYPTAPNMQNAFEVAWTDARGRQSKDIVLSDYQPAEVAVSALKTSPQVRWYMECPTNQSCYCTNGGYYSGFTIGAFDASDQDFRKEVSTSRIDVNDMKIRRQNGSSYYAKGTYKLSVDIKFNGDNTYECTLASDAPTRTGVDVARGFLYHVETTAVSEEGSTLRSKQDLDFR